MAVKSVSFESDGHEKEQIIGFMKQAEAGSASPQRICAARAASATLTFYKWRLKYGGMDIPDSSRLRELEAESNKFKKLLTEADLENTAFGVKR